MLSQSQHLNIAYVVIYAILAQPALFCMIKHGRIGFLGWSALVSFCMVRVLGNALEIKNARSEAGAIISGVGLSPLMIAILGIMHEANHYVTGKRPWYLGFWPYINMHGVIGGASGLIIAGKLHSGFTSNSSALVKIGVLVLVGVWTTMLFIGWRSYLQPRDISEARWLIIAAITTLPFLGVRVIYLTIGTFDSSVNLYTGPIAIRVIFGMVMEIAIVLRLLLAGVTTRNIKRVTSGQEPFVRKQVEGGELLYTNKQGRKGFSGNADRGGF